MSQALIDAIAEMEDEKAVSLATKMIDGGSSPLEILEDCKAGMASSASGSSGASTSSPS